MGMEPHRAGVPELVLPLARGADGETGETGRTDGTGLEKWSFTGLPVAPWFVSRPLRPRPCTPSFCSTSIHQHHSITFAGLYFLLLVIRISYCLALSSHPHRP